MRRVLLMSLAVGLLTSGLAQAKLSYEAKMISSGKNFPDFNSLNDSVVQFMVSLRKSEVADAFLKRTGWTAERYQQMAQLLLNKNFIRQKGANLIPSCMVITDKDGRFLLNKSEKIARDIAKELVLFKPTAQQQYSATAISKILPFDSAAFFIYSDVLLDNWQIRNVENLFLAKPRPERHGKNYYFAYMEHRRKEKEAFGIYGNQGGQAFSMYGNNRLNIDTKEITQNAGALPFIDGPDNTILSEMAETFRDKLVDILKNNKDYIDQIYRKSGYSNEVSFEEFFIWWYHFIYTKATDILAKQKELTIPASGNFYYRLG